MTPRFRRKASFLGTFVIVHVTSSISILFILLVMGINPTLLVSVLGAPLWITVCICSWNLTKKLNKRKYI
jgi:L-asparagine transporter-like permease